MKPTAETFGEHVVSVDFHSKEDESDTYWRSKYHELEGWYSSQLESYKIKITEECKLLMVSKYFLQFEWLDKQKELEIKLKELLLREEEYRRQISIFETQIVEKDVQITALEEWKMQAQLTIEEKTLELNKFEEKLQLQVEAFEKEREEMKIYYENYLKTREVCRSFDCLSRVLGIHKKQSKGRAANQI